MDNQFAVVPDDVLDLVVERLCLPDLYRFGMVSKLCKSVCDPLQFSDQLPWLIVPFVNNINNSTTYLRRHRKRGWLMTVHENSQVQLFNPLSLSSRVIHLPPLTKFPGVLNTIERKENEEDDVPSLFYMVSSTIPLDILKSSKVMRDTYIFKVAMSSSSVSEGKFYAVDNGGYVVVVNGLEETQEETPDTLS
ncbi:hypothetical protein IFM89_019329 [Coptis chinensis]|uniref:F-box domain-containing protein n=1 Tax=Coptis chinensis TaxID=261450 RepID=A0A835ID94_9MAGN|nr:hypothetical protein IFM89_019329 [Coptis chinensis]